MSPERKHNMAQEGLKAWFDEYLAAFNRNDFAGFGAYYADDVIFRGQAAQVVGRDAVLEFYGKVRQYLHETVEVLTFIGAEDGRHILAELKTSLVAHTDWPEMPTGPMVAGDRRESINFAFYDIAERRFTRIRTARFSPLPKAAS